MILIPFRHDSSEDVGDYKLAVQLYREAMFALEPVRIELGAVGYLRPFGLNLLAGMIYNLLRRGLDVSVTVPQSQQVEQFLMDHGFFSMISPNRSSRSSGWCEAGLFLFSISRMSSIIGLSDQLRLRESPCPV